MVGLDGMIFFLYDAGGEMIEYKTSGARDCFIYAAEAVQQLYLACGLMGPSTLFMVTQRLILSIRKDLRYTGSVWCFRRMISPTLCMMMISF